mmetsp:Transcript_25101/g.82278  ORF Transcript_25101/g.82278 Transcript_25101/m.82278 type:complete len:240 (-) Transcript_25101:857-1576(-)
MSSRSSTFSASRRSTSAWSIVERAIKAAVSLLASMDRAGAVAAVADDDDAIATASALTLDPGSTAERFASAMVPSDGNSSATSVSETDGRPRVLTHTNRSGTSTPSLATTGSISVSAAWQPMLSAATMGVRRRRISSAAIRAMSIHATRGLFTASSCICMRVSTANMVSVVATTSSERVTGWIKLRTKAFSPTYSPFLRHATTCPFSVRHSTTPSRIKSTHFPSAPFCSTVLPRSHLLR